MINKVIDGKQIAAEILNDLKNEICKIGLNRIGLAFILVGNNAASQTYVNTKKKACKQIGIQSFDFEFGESISEDELVALILELNNNPNVHGILIQQPLPKHIDLKRIIFEVDPKKDVDGFHPENIGKMVLGYEDSFVSCTPLGIFTLLQRASIEVEKKHVVIMGRSNIVGKPLANLLLQNKKGVNATVTVVHSMTPNFEHFTREADILVTAIGKPNLIKKEMVKKDAVVIDVGINRVDKNILGDVDFNDVLAKVSRITPVPGGVGPMTIASLMMNTIKSFKQSVSI